MRVLAMVVAAWLALVGAALASPTDKARADKLFEDGRKYLAAKEFALACTAFEQSQEVDPAIGTQLNIALCYEAWGKIGSAYRAYVEAERLAKQKSDGRAKGAHTKVVELAAKVPHLQIELPDTIDPSTVFLFDAKEIERAKFADDLMLDAGTHTIEARVPGLPPKIVTIDLGEGDRKKVVLDVPRPVVVAPPPPAPVPHEPVVTRSSGRLYGGIALGVAGLAALGVGTVVALGARSDYNAALANCPDHVCTTRADFDATQHARSKANDMTYVGGAGLALVGLGVFLIVTSKHVAPDHQAMIVPVVSPDSIGIAIGGRL